MVTFALTLERMAHSFSRLARLDGGAQDRGRDGCPPRARSADEQGATDTDLMRAPARLDRQGRRRGPDLCVASPDGIGVALKVEDGASRPRPAVASFVGLGDECGRRRSTNMHGETVGEITAG